MFAECGNGDGGNFDGLFGAVPTPLRMNPA